MNNETRQYAAKLLLKSKQLTGGDDPKFLPRIYVANGKCYYFLNAARRAVVGTQYPIEVMTIEEAYKIEYGQEFSATMRDMVAWNFNSTGSTYKGGNLFRDNNAIKANLVSNPIRRLNGGLYKLAILNDDINTMFLQSRVKNILLEIDCKTYGDLIKIGRKNIRDVKSIGSICIAELDAEMDRVGLTEYWMGIKTISNE